MVLGCRQILAIARNALAEMLRAPVFCLLYIAAIAIAGVLPLLDYLAFTQKRQLVADSLLALTITGGVFAAAVGAGAVLGDELGRRTALVVLAKPVARSVFLVGKMLGIAFAAGLFWAGLALALLWGSRVVGDDLRPERFAATCYFGTVVVALLLGAGADYFAGRSFASAASVWLPVCLGIGFVAIGFFGAQGKPGDGWSLVDWRLLPAAVAAYPALLLAGAVALTVSCWLEPGPTLLVTAAVFGLGLVAHGLGGWAAVLPDWQPFWVADRLAGDGHVPWSQVGRAVGYGVAYSAALVCLATVVFERRELG